MTVDWCGPAWLKPLFRGQEDSIFHRVTKLTAVSRDLPDEIADLQYLQSVVVIGSRISETAFERLSSVKKFRHDGARVCAEEHRYDEALDFTPVSRPLDWSRCGYFASRAEMASCGWDQAGPSGWGFPNTIYADAASTLASVARPTDIPSGHSVEASSDKPLH